MFVHTHPILAEAESAARNEKLPEALSVLRRLGLDDFGLFLMGLPNQDYPSLSSMLPRMASEDVQTSWTGSSGVPLLRQSATFARYAAYSFMRHVGRRMDGARILDFGCGYGRIMRLMYYFTDPINIYGLDPWDKSISICRNDGVIGHLRISEREPRELPLDGNSFDLVYALSVFTHLSERTALAAFRALRKVVADDGLLIATVRPVEYWTYHDSIKKTNIAPTLVKLHEDTGFAYSPHAGQIGEFYGDASLSIHYVEKLPGWELIDQDRSLADPYQLILTLRPSAVGDR